MTKPGSRADVSNFIQGLITEASPLNFPANASRSEENFTLNRDGTRDRRLGLDFEDGGTLVDTGLGANAFATAGLSSFKWFSVNGLLNGEFLVTQVNQKLYFFDLQTDAPSANLKGTIVLDQLPSLVNFSFTALEGRLVVASGSPLIAVITYAQDTGLFAVDYQRLQVRDQWGVEVIGTQYETDPTFRGAFDVKHVYNLRNQSWGIPRKDAGGTLKDPVSGYVQDLGPYPSNSEQVWPGLQFQPGNSSANPPTLPFERVYTNLYTEALGANTLASKGYFIIDLLRRGPSRYDQYNALFTKFPQLDFHQFDPPIDTTSGGAKVITEFAGRVWYSGFNGDVLVGDKRSPNLSDFLVFSKLVKSTSDINKCYQEGDPTSRDSNDLVDTDGGFLRVSGAKNILSLTNLASHLIVIASNGVWSITGGNNYGFSATNYIVTKLSAFGGLSESSVVVDGGRLFFWAADGIYAVGKNQYGDLETTNITQTTIQTFYDEISNDAKQGCEGMYDPFSKKARWIYQEGNLFDFTAVTKELIFDTTINAYYVNRISNVGNNSCQAIDSFPSSAFRTGNISNQVVASGNPVLASSNPVVTTTTGRTSGIQSVRYVTAVNVFNSVFLTVSLFKNQDFLDWFAYDQIGVDAKAFVMTGNFTAGDSAIAKQVPYLIMHFRRTENGTLNFIPLHQSSCMVRSQWDWADSTISNKWSPLFQAYRYKVPLFISTTSDTFDNGFETVVTKSKLRGRGRAFSLYMETEPLKDCRIIGWSLTLNGNTVT